MSFRDAFAMQILAFGNAWWVHAIMFGSWRSILGLQRSFTLLILDLSNMPPIMTRNVPLKQFKTEAVSGRRLEKDLRMYVQVGLQTVMATVIICISRHATDHDAKLPPKTVQDRSHFRGTFGEGFMNVCRPPDSTVNLNFQDALSLLLAQTCHGS